MKKNNIMQNIFNKYITNLVKEDSKMIKGNLTKKQQNKLYISLNNELKEIKEHFKTDKWDLSLDVIKDTVLMDLLGFDLTAELMKFFYKNKISIKYESEKGFSLYNQNYEPVYYDKKNNKIIIGRLTIKQKLNKQYLQLGEL